MWEFLKFCFFDEIWGFKRQFSAKIAQIWPNLTFEPPYFIKKWKFQKIPHSNERTPPNDDLGPFIASQRQFKSRSIIFPKSPIEKKWHFHLYRKSLYIIKGIGGGSRVKIFIWMFQLVNLVYFHTLFTEFENMSPLGGYLARRLDRRGRKTSFLTWFSQKSRKKC